MLNQYHLPKILTM